MPESNGHRRVAMASHSHLFPGALLRMATFASEELAMEMLTIVFSDGAEAQAEFMKVVGIPDAAADLVLLVNGYTTAAGTVIPQRIWQIRGHSIEEGELILRVGRCLGS